MQTQAVYLHFFATLLISFDKIGSYPFAFSVCIPQCPHKEQQLTDILNTEKSFDK